MERVSILGCGWVGKALQKKLSNTYQIYCLSRDIKANEDANMYDCDTLVIAIPPRDNYIEVLSKTLEKIDKSTQIILLSSTSFYKGKELVIKAEELLENHLILRLGGLMGYDRIAGKYTSGKIKEHDSFVNYIHRDDVVNIIKRCIELELTKEVFDVVSPLHPSQSEIYNQNTKRFGWEETHFNSSEVLGEVISSEKLINNLDYKFLKPNPMEFWSE